MISQSFGKVLNWLKDSCGRILSLLIETQNRSRINLMNIYAPTALTERKDFYNHLHEFFIPADFTILGGDFNCYERESDKFGGNVSPARYLSDFRSAFNLVDIWRKLHPQSREVSWFNPDFSIGTRLDKFFVTRNLVDSVSSCSITPCCFSDHDFVDLHFNLDNNSQHSPGLWKFNTSLLMDKDFCTLITERILDLANCIDLFSSVKEWWDFLKSSLQAEIVAFSRERRKNLSRERVSITNQIINLKRRIVQGEVTLSNEVDALESRLRALITKQLEGVKIRSRARWFEEGERPTRFFFKLEGERKEKHAVSSIFNSDGVEVFTPDGIERAHVDFYSSLFSPEEIDYDRKRDLLDSVNKTLGQADRELCERAISLAELTESINSLSLNKSPGPDGFPVEFYKCFWDPLGPLLLRVANQCFQSNSLCDSMKGSATRLLFKKRGDRRDLKNWRPISLLNVDYKIISKVITTRLSCVLDTIVDPDQTCSVPGRSIVYNNVLLRDILDYIERTDETAILVSLDQEKAFDRVDRGFLMVMEPTCGLLLMTAFQMKCPCAEVCGRGTLCLPCCTSCAWRFWQI